MEELKEKVQELVKKIESDNDFAEKFKKEPIKAVEEVLGVDLPDDKINSVIDAVKAKITVNDIKKATNTIQGFFR